MKRQIAAMMTGAILAMSAITLPAFANGSIASPQPLLGERQQTQAIPETGSGTQQQKWSIDEKGAKVSWLISASVRETFNEFKAGIEQGLSPRQAAKKAGATEVKSTRNRYRECTNGRYLMTLNLGKKGFVTLRIDRPTKVVKVLQMGTRHKLMQT
jgi:hypothetical protein